MFGRITTWDWCDMEAVRLNFSFFAFLLICRNKFCEDNRWFIQQGNFWCFLEIILEKPFPCTQQKFEISCWKNHHLWTLNFIQNIEKCKLPMWFGRGQFTKLCHWKFWTEIQFCNPIFIRFLFIYLMAPLLRTICVYSVGKCSAEKLRFNI